ncbi:MAG: thioredoxin domain-containing protein [Actinomycetes bacterium]
MSGHNRLGAATSPYLLQHADNPVHWWPWSDEAFAEARARDLPVLLSVGYAACHWCHVMAHESFEDPEIAAQMNASFVSVKVDREERPDVDAVYMSATQAMTGQGGWPMTVFLTPDGRPFYAGTYFPPRPRGGLPSFPQILDAVAAAWRDRREEVLTSAAGIAEQLAGHRPAGLAGAVTAEDLTTAVEALQRDFDPTYAGFGTAPKFPPSMVLEALLRLGDPEATRMAAATCTAMARGGIYDQLAGGFARYSVDAGWVVPHFEKMLYDNALLLGVYTHWWRRQRDPLAERVVVETVEWLRREMRTPEGGFASSLDADSRDASGHLHEGAFYVWQPDDLSAVLGPEDAAWAAESFRVTATGTFERGLSTLQLRPEADPVRLADVRARLFAAREARARPGRDDKVVAAWNGWLIGSLTQAAQVFARADWVGAAAETGELVWRVHWDGSRLRRTSRDGRVGTAPAILEDYTALAFGYTHLAAATADARWVERAEALLTVVLDQFSAPDGSFYDTAADAEALYTRPQDPTDNATPSGLSSAVHALSLLAELTGEDRWATRAEQAAASAGELVRRAPRFAGWLLADAVSRTVRPPLQVAVVGPPADPDTRALALTAVRGAPAGSVVVTGEPDTPGMALLADRPLRQERPTAYVCRGFVCRLPVTTVAELEAQLADA